MNKFSNNSHYQQYEVSLTPRYSNLEVRKRNETKKYLQSNTEVLLRSKRPSFAGNLADSGGTLDKPSDVLSQSMQGRRNAISDIDEETLINIQSLRSYFHQRSRTISALLTTSESWCSSEE